MGILKKEIEDFFEKSKLSFAVFIKDGDGKKPDITNDEVSIMMKRNLDDPDSAAVLSAIADTESLGSDGTALFNIDQSSVPIPVGTYHYNIRWVSETVDEVVNDGVVTVKPRVKD